MEISPLQRLSEATLRCPTCRAKQQWSDTCRRCKCDLSLLHQVARACHQQRRLCLEHLQAGHYRRALQHARRYYDWCPNHHAARLLAVCHLLCRHWPDALAIAQALPDEP